MGKWDKYAVEETTVKEGGNKWDKYAVEETVAETPVKETPAETAIPTVTMDANDGLVPEGAGEFDIKNPTKANGVINIPKGGVTSVALQVEHDKLAQNQSEYVKNAKNEIRKLAINTDFSAPPVDPMEGQQQQSIDGGQPEMVVAPKVTDYEQALNYIINPENTPENQIQLSPEDKEDLAKYAQTAAQSAPAIQQLSKQLEQTPDDVKTLNDLADVLAHTDDTAQALSLYSKANAIKENSQSLIGLGNAYLKAGNYQEAENAFWEAYDPNNPETTESQLHTSIIRAYYSEAANPNIDAERRQVLQNNIDSTFKQEEYQNDPYLYALSAYNKEMLGDKKGAAVDNATYEILRQQEMLPESVNADDPNSDYAKERASQAARLGAIHDAIAAPINFFGEMEMGTIEGGIHGLKNFGEGLAGTLMGGDKIGSILNIFNGAAETVFSGAMLGIAPGSAGGVRAIGVNAGFHMLPESVNKVLMQPLNVIGNLSDTEVAELSKNQQAMLALGNTIGSIAILGAVHKGPKKFTEKENNAILSIVKGEAIDSEGLSLKQIVDKAKKVLEDSKLTDFQAAEQVWKSIPEDLSIQDKMTAIPDLIKRERLQEEMAKASPAFKNYFKEKIDKVDEDINAKLSINLGLKEQAEVVGNKSEAKVDNSYTYLEKISDEQVFEGDRIAPDLDTGENVLVDKNRYRKSSDSVIKGTNIRPIDFEAIPKTVYRGMSLDVSKRKNLDTIINQLDSFEDHSKSTISSNEKTGLFSAIAKMIGLDIKKNGGSGAGNTWFGVTLFTSARPDIAEGYSKLFEQKAGAVSELKIKKENPVLISREDATELLGGVPKGMKEILAADKKLRDLGIDGIVYDPTYAEIAWLNPKENLETKRVYKKEWNGSEVKSSDLFVNEKLIEAEKTKTAEAPPKTITNESEKVRKEQEGQGEVSGKQQERQNDGQKTEVQQEVLIPEYSEKLKDVSPETKVTELPDGLSVEFNGEKGTIGRSETGETLFINAEGKETIVGGGGDVATLAEKGISRTEGTYSDKRGDYYVKDGRVFEVTKDGLKPVYEGEKANIERKEAIIRKALNPDKPKVVEQKTSNELSVINKKDVIELTEDSPELNTIEHDLKNGDKVTANIFGKKVEGTVTGVGKYKDQIVIDFKDVDGNERFIYADQIENIESAAPKIENITTAQKNRIKELLSRDELSAENLNELKSLTDIRDGKQNQLDPVIPADELQFPTKEQWEIDRDAAKEHDKLFDEDEIRAAYEQRDQDLSQIGRAKDYKEQLIHENFGGITEAQWNRFGDSNWLKGKEGKKFRKKYIKNSAGKTDANDIASFTLDSGDGSSIEITPQDVVDYIIDRESNPQKYDGRLKQWNDAASIPKKDVSSILTGDDAMVAAIVESNRGFGMTDLEADTIKRYVESKAKNEARAKNTKSGSAEGAPKSAGATAKSERVGRKPSEKAQKKKDEAKSVKAEENKYVEAEKKITKIFDTLREKLKSNAPEGTQKMGLDAKDVLDAAEKIVKAALKAGEAIEKAIQKGKDYISENWKKEYGEIDENNVFVEPKPTKVYHGGSKIDISKASADNPVFISESKEQAGEYAKGNKGGVQEFEIDKNSIANEDVAREVISEMNLKSKNPEWNVEELNLFELIDPRFDTSLSNKDIKKVYSKLKEKGYTGIEFYDTNLVTLKQDIKNIVLFDSKRKNIEASKYEAAEKSVASAFEKLREKAKNNPLFKDYSPEGAKKGGGGMEDLLNAAEKVIIGAIRAGEKIDVAIGKGIDHLRDEWKKTFDSEFPEKEIRDILSEDKQFSIKNENSEARLEEMGMTDAYREVTDEAARSFGAVWDEADAEIKKNPVAGEVLRKDLEKNPRPITDKEAALLLRDQIDLENKREKTADALNEAKSEKERTALSIELNKINNELFDNFVASKLVGRETARGLNARKMLATRKYSLVNLSNELRSVQDGKPLTAEQEKMVYARYKEIKEKAANWDKFQADYESYLKESPIDNIKESIAREKKVRPKSVLSEAEISRKKELSSKYRGVFNDVTNVAKAALEKEFYEYAGLVLKEAAGDFAEFSKEMMRSVGKNIRSRLPEIYKEITGKSAPIDANGIKKVDGKLTISKELIRNLVESGVEDINDIVSAIREIEPELTEREVRDAVSDYGKTINVSKDEIDVKIRQARQMGRLISALEDVENKQRPLKSGLQRDKLTDQARRLQAQIKELMKDLPEDVAETEAKWKTSLDAQKTRVKNQISDLDQKIENIKNGIPNKEEVKKVFKKDDELNTLIEQRDERREVLQALEGKKEMSAEQRIQNAVNAVERSIKNVEDKIANNKLEKDPVKKLSSPKLDALRDELSLRKSDLEKMRDDAGLIQKERNERYRKSAEKRIEDYQKRKAAGDFAPKKRTQTELDQKSLELQADLNMAKAEWEMEKEKVRLKNLGMGEKAINWITKYFREGLLTGIGTLFKLASFAITRQAAIRPLYNITGEMLRVLPGVRVLAEGAPIEGKFNGEALGENYKAMVSKNTRRQALQKLRKGKSNNDLVYGKDLMRELPMLPTRSHGAIKQFAYQAEFAYAKKSLERWAEKRGMDNNPVLQKWIGEYAHAKGLDAIYMGEANLLKIYQLALRQGDIKGGSGKAFTKIARLLFPITKVPYNFVKDVALHSPVSLGVHAAKLARKSFTDTIKDMTPEQKDLLMLNLKKGALGTAMYALGYFGKQNFGGNYSLLLKRYQGDKDAGDLDINGVHIPHFATHNALAEIAQLGATSAKMFDALEEKGSGATEAAGWSMLMSSLSEVEKAPFVGETSRLLTSLKQPKGVTDYTGQFIASRIIPRIVSEFAEVLDGEKRKVTTFTDRFKAKIPVLREELPVKVKEERPGQEVKKKKIVRRKRSGFN